MVADYFSIPSGPSKRELDEWARQWPQVPQSQTRPPDSRMALIIDLSAYHDTATLLIRCHDCGAMFQSDFEESFCGCCVERRELISPAPGTAL
jgi:hypothetical protein